MSTTLLSEQELRERRDALFAAQARRLDESQQVRTTSMEQAFRYVRPLSQAYAQLVDIIQTHEDRFTLGLAPIDLLTRGFGPKELILITGFSHAGKTQLVNTAILRNPEKRVLFFSMDDPTEMILLKLACMQLGVDAETLERRIREGDEEAKLALKRVAARESLIVVDESLGLSAMDEAIREAIATWDDQAPDVVIIDYLASMQDDNSDDDGGIKRKIAALKRWVKNKPFPTLVLHQQTRGKGGPGAPVNMLSGAYGGEQEATMLIGIRRKRDDAELDQFVRDQLVNTVTLHLVKNKWPPCKITPYEGLDFFLDPATGLIRQLRDEDLRSTHTQVMERARRDLDG